MSESTLFADKIRLAQLELFARAGMVPSCEKESEMLGDIAEILRALKESHLRYARPQDVRYVESEKNDQAGVGVFISKCRSIAYSIPVLVKPIC